MKKYTARLFVIGMMLASSMTSYAQKVIKVHDHALKDSIGENAKRNTKQLGYLLLLKRLSKKTKNTVEATQQLQQNYREFLKQTSNTASLAVANHEAGTNGMNGVKGTANRLGDYSFANYLRSTYTDRTEPREKSQRLYDQFVPYDATLVFTDLPSFTTDQRARQLNVAALKEMSDRRKLQLARAYQQLSQQKITQADELRRQLTQNRQFSMTEAERMELLRRVQDDLLGSQQLKAQADALIQQVGRDSFSKQQVLDRFWQAHEREVIAATPLF